MNWDALLSMGSYFDSPWAGGGEGQSSIMPVGPAIPFAPSGGHPGFVGQPVPGPSSSLPLTGGGFTGRPAAGPTSSLPPTGFVGQPVAGPVASPYGHYLE
jgi:hypothetical protein